MKLLELFFIVVIASICIVGIIFAAGSSTPPSNVTNTFGQSQSNNATNTSYGLVQNVTAVETQGGSMGIIILGACAILVILFAFVVLASGKYSKGKYRT